MVNKFILAFLTVCLSTATALCLADQEVVIASPGHILTLMRMVAFGSIVTTIALVAHRNGFPKQCGRVPDCANSCIERNLLQLNNTSELNIFLLKVKASSRIE